MTVSERSQNDGYLRKLWDWLKTSEPALTAAGTILTAIGSLAVAWQAHLIANQSKVTAVLSFQEKRIQEEPLVESFKKVNEVILVAKEKLETLERKEYRKYISETVDSENQAIVDDIQLALSFYRGVANCVNQGACDKDAALAIFGEDVRDFNVVFAPYFCDIAERIQEDQINEGLATFYGSEGGGLNKETCSVYTASKL